MPNYGATGPDPAISFGWGDKLAPRLGFAWDVVGDTKWKIYGSYGSYYDVTKYEMPRGSFGGDKWVDYWFTMDSPDPGLNTPAGGCTVGANTIFDVPTCGRGLCTTSPTAVSTRRTRRTGSSSDIPRSIRT